VGGQPAATSSERPNGVGLGTLGSLGDLELHSLRLIEAAVAVGLDRGVVHEDVGTAAVLRNESEPFSALNHFTVP
jgi:hypothetical protein